MAMVGDQPVLRHPAVPAEVKTEYAGTGLGAYYTDASVMLLTQRSARRAFRAQFGIDLGEPGCVEMPACVSWNLFTVRDMLEGSPQSIVDAFVAVACDY